MADPDFDSPGDIDILSGADIFPNIFTGNILSHPGDPAALDTIFGYVFMFV